MSVRELRPYERLATLTGPARLMYAVDTHIADPVYNIEVEGENCYRVGEAGTLVHNASVDMYVVSFLTTYGFGALRAVAIVSETFGPTQSVLAA